MTIPRKGSRLIVVGERRYRWYVRRQPTYAQALAETSLSIAVELVESPAQTLHVQFDVSRPDAWRSAADVSVTPRVVAAVIRRALTQGWQPTAAGRPFAITASVADGGELPRPDQRR